VSVLSRTTVGLASLFVGLLAWIWLVERPPAAPTIPEAPFLLNEPGQRIGRVEFTGRTGLITATRVANDWLDGKGRPWPHDAVTDLLATLRTLRPLRTIVPEAGESARYGLGQRRLRIVLHDGSVALDLELGTINPAQTALYARTTGQTEIVLIGTVLEWELSKVERTGHDGPNP
jgi:Domain of unknown function (DUF4340)